MPDAGDHPLIPEVAGIAGFAAALAGDFERAEARAAAAEQAQPVLGLAVPSVLQARFVLA
jgi:hypothetical protein